MNINEIRRGITEVKATIQEEYREDDYNLPSFEDRCKSNTRLTELKLKFQTALKATPKTER